MVANPLSLAMLNPPALFGIDIVCGDGQALGGRLNFGGPAFGLLASKGQYLRHMPGRIIGKTHDKDGSPAYCLTLQTREQHIRRQKATSNICSNHSLNAIGAAIYLSLMGEKGLRSVSLMSFDNAQYLYQRLKEIRGIKLPYGRRFFNEFVWEVEEAASVMEKLRNKNIIAGYYLGNDFPEFKNRILSCCTETKSKDDIDNFIQELAEVLHG
jgi:glycine dehydrogenase subunit 1